MTGEELYENAEKLQRLLEEALEEMEDAGERRRFSRCVRNRLKLLMVPVREDDGAHMILIAPGVGAVDDVLIKGIGGLGAHAPQDTKARFGHRAAPFRRSR